MNTVLKPFAAALLALAPAAPAAAQELSFSMGIHSRDSIWSAHVGNGRGAHVGLSIGKRGRSVATTRVWVPGHQQQVERLIWVPGAARREWLPPVYATRYDGYGRPYRVIVREGRWQSVCEPGRYERRIERVWVPGGYETVRY